MHIDDVCYISPIFTKANIKNASIPCVVCVVLRYSTARSVRTTVISAVE